MLPSSVEHIKSLWSVNDLSDVRILILGKEYNLHKAILVQSPYFAVTFSERWRKCDSSIPTACSHTSEPFLLDLEDVDCSSKTAELVLKAMYGYDLNIACLEEGLEVHCFASFLQLEEMAKVTVQRMHRLLSVQAAVEFYNYAETRSPHPGLLDFGEKCRAMLLLEGFAQPDLLAQLHSVEKILQEDAFVVIGGEFERAKLIAEIIKTRNTLLLQDGEKCAKRARTDSPCATCPRLEFLTMQQWRELSNQTFPDDDYMWRRICIQAVMCVEAPVKVHFSALRSYRQCINFKNFELKNDKVSAEPFDAYGSSWVVSALWVQRNDENTLTVSITRNNPSNLEFCDQGMGRETREYDFELRDQGMGRKYDFILHVLDASAAKCSVLTKAIEVPRRRLEKRIHGVTLAIFKGALCHKYISCQYLSLILHITPHLE